MGSTYAGTPVVVAIAVATLVGVEGRQTLVAKIELATYGHRPES